MTVPPDTSPPSTPLALIVIISPERQLGGELRVSLESILGSAFKVRNCPDVTTAESEATAALRDGLLMPVAFVFHDNETHNGAEILLSARDLPVLGRARYVMVSREPSLHGVDQALHHGALHGMITYPWTGIGLRQQVAAQIATSIVDNDPDRLGEFDFLLSADDRERAAERIAQARNAPDTETSRRHLLLAPDRTADQVKALLIEALDSALGHPPRLRVAPGTVLIEQGENVGGFYLILEGAVQLSSATSGTTTVLHERSTGSIIGLLSLAEHRSALFRSRAVTDVRAIPITFDQLGLALARDPGISEILTKVLVDSLARRLRRSSQLQLELDQSLHALSEAKATLVSTAKFSALGEMSAGIAHELNNPAAALIRSIDHIRDDISRLVAGQPAAALLSSTASTVLSTSETRALRRQLSEDLADSALASQLVDAGITDVDTARRVAEAGPDASEAMLAAARLGQSLSNARQAAAHVQSLVESLSNYTRGADGRGSMEEGIDVAIGIDRALRLLHHRLGGITLERLIRPTPPVTARPGALQQVWTNLIANAAEAMDGAGTLTLRVNQEGGFVRVELIDDGPGIAPDIVDQIFEPRFTTKGGQIRFGLGLGLSITRQIVEEHRGTIGVNSRPGHTVFTVDLPTGETHE